MANKTLTLQAGLIPQAKQCLSPNCDARPDPNDISLLVIHNISLPPGEFGGGYIEDFFCNQLDHQQHPFFTEIEGVKVSAHLVINRQGELIQFVPFHQRAWHAGLSCFEGRERCNDFSIGIELEGTDHTPYTQAQYKMLSDVTQLIMACYPAIKQNRITGHQDIAPERKTDPGPAFDWQYYRNALKR